MSLTSRLRALLSAANDKTGASDTTLTAAVNTLIDGYGGGEDRSIALLNRTITEYNDTDGKITGSPYYGFFYCQDLLSVSFPEITSIATCMFSMCTKLRSVSLPKATKIGSSAFNNCMSLTDISFPLVTYIDSSAFNYCNSLVSVYFPQAATIGSSAFSDCSKIESMSFPAAAAIQSSAFSYCSSLTTLSLPAATSIGSYQFSSCSALTTLIVGTNNGGKVCTYSATSSSQDPSNANLKIYVPDSLVSSYKSATNWSRLASHIYGISTYTGA